MKKKRANWERLVGFFLLTKAELWLLQMQFHGTLFSSCRLYINTLRASQTAIIELVLLCVWICTCIRECLCTQKGQTLWGHPTVQKIYSNTPNKSGNPLSHRVHSPLDWTSKPHSKSGKWEWEDLLLYWKWPSASKKKKMLGKISIFTYNEQGYGINYHHTIHLHTKCGNSRELRCLRNSGIIEGFISKRLRKFKGSPWNDFGSTEKVTHIMSCGCINENEYFNVYRLPFTFIISAIKCFIKRKNKFDLKLYWTWNIHV